MDNSYDIVLPEKVSSIVEREFWLHDDITGEMLSLVSDPVKFTAFTSIFVKKGRCKATINFMEFVVEAPCVVNVRCNNILQPTEMSRDFLASFVVMSDDLAQQVFRGLQGTPFPTVVSRSPFVKLTPELYCEFIEFYRSLRLMTRYESSPYFKNLIKHSMLSFFYKTAYKCYQPLVEAFHDYQSRLVDTFIRLVQENFRKERFLDYYATKLEITTKHLSRSVKKQTGYTAVEWIERFVILEAKALLKSTNLNIQQISEELNFPSQSFFGKYFKKYAGMSPKEYRNA